MIRNDWTYSYANVFDGELNRTTHNNISTSILHVLIYDKEAETFRIVFYLEKESKIKVEQKLNLYSNIQN